MPAGMCVLHYYLGDAAACLRKKVADYPAHGFRMPRWCRKHGGIGLPRQDVSIFQTRSALFYIRPGADGYYT